jgi:hypothetical protein
MVQLALRRSDFLLPSRVVYSIRSGFQSLPSNVRGMAWQQSAQKRDGGIGSALKSKSSEKY